MVSPRTLPVASLVAALALLLTACPQSGQVSAPELTVTIASPNRDVAANGSVTLQISVGGGAPDGVRLLRDGDPFVTLDAPYTYSWDTTADAEGSYQIVAEADAGGSSFQSDPVTVTVDRTPPTVTGRAPTPGQANVSARTTLVATFGEGLLASTITTATVVLESDLDGVLAATLDLSDDGRTLTVTPDVVPSVPATLTLTFTTAITDLAGNPLALPGDAWSFALPVWLDVGDPLSAEPGGTTALFPSLSVGTDGNPVVAWRESDGATFNVYVQRWDGSAWESLGGALSANPGTTAADYPSLSMGTDGNPVIAWQEPDGTTSNVYVQRWNGSGWEPLGSALSANPGTTDAEYPSLSMGTDGNPVIAWQETDGAAIKVYVQRWNGSAWEPLGGALSAQPGGTGAFSASLGVGTDGNPVIAWYESDGITDNIYVRRWNGASWDSLGGALSANPGTTDAVFPSLGVGTGGYPTVAWRETDGTARNVYVRRWNGSIWQSLGGALSANPGTTNASVPFLSVGTDGNPVVAWNQSDGTASNVYVRRWNGTVWQSLGGALSANPGSTSADEPSLGIGTDGNPVVAWREDDGTTNNVYVRRYNQ